MVQTENAKAGKSPAETPAETPSGDTGPDETGPGDIAALARGLMRAARFATLATVDAPTGAPYASLVAVAVSMGCTPLLMISDLALHTRNMKADPRASLLFAQDVRDADPLEHGRVTVMGVLERFGESEDSEGRDGFERARYLRAHPGAEVYAGFGDFHMVRLVPESAHYIGGFGRIHTLAAGDFMPGDAGAAAIGAAEAGIVVHMNDDHGDAVALYAQKLLAGPPGAWRMAACDLEGCDLVLGAKRLRLDFPRPVTTPEAMRAMLVRLAREARER